MGITNSGKEKPRGQVKRKRKPVLLISVEGKNKTEKIYFSRLNNHSKYAINFTKHSDKTDPVNLMKSLINEVKNNGLKLQNGDKGVCIFDTDLQSDNKQDQIIIAMKYQNEMIKTILSCPCIESWFLCHFFYSTCEYSSNEAVVNRLKEEIPNYSKGKDIFNIIFPKTEEAVKNAKKLEQYHINNYHDINSYESNPSSQIYRLVEDITNTTDRTR